MKICMWHFFFLQVFLKKVPELLNYFGTFTNFDPLKILQ